MNGYQAEGKSHNLICLAGTLGPTIIYPDSIKLVSEAVFSRYDQEGKGCLSFEDVEQMMKDMYTSINLSYSPTKREVEEFMRHMDVEKNSILNERNVDRLARKHLATSKYDIVKNKYTDLKSSDNLSHLSISSKTSERQVEMISPLSQTQSINFKLTQPLQTQRNFGNTENLGAGFAKGYSAVTTACESRYDSKENFNPCSNGVQAKLTFKVRDDVQQAFSEFDFNKDGKISCFECHRSLMRFGWKFGINPTKINLETLFTKADSDHDGLITVEEFSACILRL